MSKTLESLDSGGAPSRGQPLAVEFANTSYAVRGQPREGIGTPEHLAAWLRDHAHQVTTELPPATLLQLSQHDTRPFLALREAVRDLCAAVLDGHSPPQDAIDELNRAAAVAPCWPALSTRPEGFQAAHRTDSPPVQAVLAEIARDAIRILSGPECHDLRHCPGPGCILYFIKDHPRREWCSTQCSTRARVARHYRRHKPNNQS
jgi:predicted RNA-binding Zn ribbon-like protein